MRQQKMDIKDLKKTRQMAYNIMAKYAALTKPLISHV